MKQSNTRKLVINIAMMFIVYLSPKIFSFLLIPVYTSYLSTEEYGISDLILSISSFFMPIISLATPSAIMRFTIENKNDVRPFQLSIKVYLRGLFFLFISLFIILIYFDIPKVYCIFIFAIVASSVFADINMSYTRGIERIKLITVCGVISSFIGIVCNVLFIVYLNLGVIGFLSSTICSYLFSIFFLSVYNRNRKIYKNFFSVIAPQFKREMLSFSVPLIFSSLCWMVISSSDKYFVAALCGISVTGMYAVAYKIPIIIQAVSDVFGQAWTFTVYDNYSTVEGKSYISKILNYYSFLLCFVSSFLISINIYLSEILFSNDFFKAWLYVPFLIISVMFSNISSLMSIFLTVYKKTAIVFRISLVVASSNLLLNYIFISIFNDAIGAAIATMISFSINLILSTYYGLKYSKIKLSIKKNTFMYCLLIIQSILLVCLSNEYVSFLFTLMIVVINKDNLSILCLKISSKIKKYC